MNKEKIFTIIIIHLLLYVNLYAENSEKYLKSYVENYNSAFLNKNYEKLCSMMPKQMIDILGGKRNIIELCRQSILNLEKNNMKLSDISIDEYSNIVSENNEHFAMITIRIISKSENQILILDDYLFAISIGNKYNWFLLPSTDTVIKIIKSYDSIYNSFSIPKKRMTFINIESGKIFMIFDFVNGKWQPTPKTVKKLNEILNNANK